MDWECYQVLSRLSLPNIHLIPLEDFEEQNKELLRTKENRTRVEYYFTCTPSLPLYILSHFSEVDCITYLDADLFFFDNPSIIYSEMGSCSIGIIGHRFPPSLRTNERYGIYNVGWVSFRRDQHALACLHWWRERCIEWCYDRIEPGRFADQKYLDDWPARFQGVVVLRHKGGNLAPWNLANYKIHTVKSRVWVDEESLIFFHFHGLKRIKNWLFYPNLAPYRVKPSRVVLKNIYAPYIRTVLDLSKQVAPLMGMGSLYNGIREAQIQSSASPQVSLSSPVMKLLRSLLKLFNWIRTQSYILVLNDHVL